MSDRHDRPPDFETENTKIWFRNPEDMDTALKNMVVHMYKKWLRGELVLKGDEKSQQPA